MTCVIIEKNGVEIERRDYAIFREALAEYRRQTRNAWRRKSTYNAVQFFTGFPARMQYWRDGDRYDIELTQRV